MIPRRVYVKIQVPSCTKNPCLKWLLCFCTKWSPLCEVVFVLNGLCTKWLDTQNSSFVANLPNFKGPRPSPKVLKKKHCYINIYGSNQIDSRFYTTCIYEEQFCVLFHLFVSIFYSTAQILCNLTFVFWTNHNCFMEILWKLLFTQGPHFNVFLTNVCRVVHLGA